MHQNSLYKNRFYNEFYARINRKVVLVYVAHNKKQYRILLHTFYKIVDSTSLLDDAANYLVAKEAISVSGEKKKKIVKALDMN